MNVNEAMLFICMKNLQTKYERTLLLEKYIQRYGPLSDDGWEKVIELIMAGDDVKDYPPYLDYPLK